MTQDNFKGCRLEIEEEQHLSKFWSNKFSDFVHAAFRVDIDKVKTNKTKNRIQSMGTNLIYLGFGVMILFQMFNLDFLSLGWFIVFALGMCFFGIGFYGIIVEVKPFGKRRK